MLMKNNESSLSEWDSKNLLSSKIKCEVSLFSGDFEDCLEENSYHLPCACGCDNRDDPNLLGYFHGRNSEGTGYSLKVYDPVLHEVIIKCGGVNQSNPN